MERIRTIITQDAEMDDQNSLRHFLFYANEVDLQGIVQTSSKFHWKGIPGAVKEEKLRKDDFGISRNGDFDKPYRWPGTQWMFRVIDDYEKDYPQLIKHADGYPTPDYLRSITKVGNVGYEGEMEAPTEGSELIRERILDNDPRPLYVQIWGGTNTLARALLDIQKEYQNKPEWKSLHEMISKKVIATACGEQDPAYSEYVAEEWPDLKFVKTLQMESYAYFWMKNPEGESKKTMRASFIRPEILDHSSALVKGYCTWGDGHYLEGEDTQFLMSMDEAEKAAQMWHCPAPGQYDFVSEGDSPTYFPLFDWGFRSLEDFTYGGISGRYYKVDRKNSKGQPVNVWDVCKDDYTDCFGTTTKMESMWKYVCDIQRDFAARVQWVDAPSYEDGEHAPKLMIREGLDLNAAPGETITLHAEARSTDRQSVTISYEIYKDASAESAADAMLKAAVEGVAADAELQDAGEKTEADAVLQDAGAKTAADAVLQDAGKKTEADAVLQDAGEKTEADAVLQDPGAKTAADAEPKNAGAGSAADNMLNIELLKAQNEISLIIPESAKTGDQIHIIIKAQAGGHLHLVHYQQVIITIL